MNAQTDSTINLALALEGSARPASDEVSRLAGVAGMLKTLPDPEIDPRFVARLEAVLMAQFDATEATPAPALHLVKPAPAVAPEVQPKVERPAPNVITLPRRRFVMRKVVAAAIAAAMLSALPVVASASALPGSPFFGIERWRQNQQVSHAHGAQRGFVEERLARKWIGYGAQMVALDYSADQINGVLQHAAWLQTQAVKMIGSFGGPSEVAALQAMLKADFNALQRIGGVAPGAIKPIVQLAMAIVADLTNQLNQLGAPAALPQVVDAGAITEPVSRGSADAKDGTRNAQPQAPVKAPDFKKTGPTTDHDPITVPTDPGCETVFSKQLGDTLTPVSVTKCRVDNGWLTKH